MNKGIHTPITYRAVIAEALGDGHGLELGLLGGIKEKLGKGDSDVVQIMLEGDDALVGRVGAPGGQMGGHGVDTGSEGGLGVFGVEGKVLGVGGIVGPVNNTVTELADNRTDTVVDVTIWGADVLHSEASDLKDGLLGPLDLGDDLLVGEGGKGEVGPGVGGDVMALVVLLLEDGGVPDDVAAHDEEGGLDIVGLEGGQQRDGVGGGACTEGHVDVKMKCSRAQKLL